MKYSDETVQKIIELRASGKGVTEIGKILNLDRAAVSRNLKKLGIDTSRNTLIKDIFRQIDTEEKAYWLGFLYADGTVASHTSAIGITLTDEEHVEKFKTAIGAINHKIVAEHSKNFPNAKTLYHLEVKDKQLHKDLVELGCIPNKSLNLTKIPNIPRDYVSHFIRGYFDGDGSLHYLKATNNYRISFVGTFDFLNDIQKELQTNVSLHYGSSGKAYMLQISGRKQVERVLNYIYQDSTESMRLNRKYQTYLNCLQWAHRN